MRPSTATAISILPGIVRASTATGADIDALVYDGPAFAVMDAAAQGSGITANVKFQHASLTAGESYTTVGTNNIVLRNGATDNVLLAAKFTKSGASVVKKATLKLKAVGTLGSGDVWVTILADSSGPTGSALVTSAKIAASSISTSEYQDVTFTFATGLALADSTVYHLVLQGDFSASSSNHVTWRTATVASGGNSAVYDTSWAAVATNSHEFALWQLTFADVTSGAFAEVGNAASFQTLGLNLSPLGRYLRVVNTVAGGSATGALGVSLVVGQKYV